MRVTSLNIPTYSFASPSGGASKYFEKTTGYSCGDTLIWDGNTDGLEFVIQSQEGLSFSVGYYRVSSSVLTVDDVSNGLTATVANVQTGEFETNTVGAEEAQGLFNEDGTAAIGTFVNIPVDGCILYDMTFPKAGIYCLALIDHATSVTIPLAISLTIPGYNFMVSTSAEVIKTEHLPQALRFGEITTTTYGDTLTWDGNTDGLVNLGGGFYKVSDTIPTLNDIHQGFSLTANAINGIGSDTISVSAEEAASITMFDNGVILLEGVYILTQPITGTTDDGTTITFSAGVYFGYFEDDNVYVSSLTINNYKGFPTTGTELVKIDKKYLPDDIGGGVSSEDIETLKEYVDSAIQSAIGDAIAASY